jgi:2-keto-4-pentenoate hydratase
MTPDEIEQLGASLADCRRRGITRDLPLDRIASDEEAEVVQAAALDAYGGAPCGYSIQATSALTRRLLCCEAPVFGPLVDTDIVQSGADFRLPRGVLGAGAAFAFVFGRPYPGDDELISRATIQKAISTCRLAIEILGRRVPGSTPLNPRTATADFALNVLFVRGPRIDHWADLDLAAAQVSARIDGQVAARGCGAEVMTHPLDALVWLAGALMARGRELEAGELVTTGTCLGLLQVIPGQTFEADFGELGRVAISLN